MPSTTPLSCLNTALVPRRLHIIPRAMDRIIQSSSAASTMPRPISAKLQRPSYHVPQRAPSAPYPSRHGLARDNISLRPQKANSTPQPAPFRPPQPVPFSPPQYNVSAQQHPFMMSSSLPTSTSGDNFHVDPTIAPAQDYHVNSDVSKNLFLLPGRQDSINIGPTALPVPREPISWLGDPHTEEPLQETPPLDTGSDFSSGQTSLGSTISDYDDGPSRIQPYINNWPNGSYETELSLAGTSLHQNLDNIHPGKYAYAHCPGASFTDKTASHGPFLNQGGAIAYGGIHSGPQAGLGINISHQGAPGVWMGAPQFYLPIMEWVLFVIELLGLTGNRISGFRGMVPSSHVNQLAYPNTASFAPLV